MQRYFINDPEAWEEDRVKVGGEDFHHISRVMRMKEGDHVTCVNHESYVAKCRLSQLTTDQAIFVIEEWLDERSELPVDVTLVQAIPKRDKFELILQKATELGVNRVIPYQADRSIAKWDDKKFDKRLSRYEKIVKEASEQSKRQVVPLLTKPFTLKEVLKESKRYDYVFFAYEETARSYQTNALSTFLDKIDRGSRILICIGPEGGFSLEEVEQFKENHWQAIRLGKRILRTETAPLYVLSVLSFYFEEQHLIDE